MYVFLERKVQVWESCNEEEEKEREKRVSFAFPIAELFVQRNETRDCASPVDDDAR